MSEGGSICGVMGLEVLGVLSIDVECVVCREGGSGAK